MPETKFRDEEFSAEALFNVLYAAKSETAMPANLEKTLKLRILQNHELREKISTVNELWMAGNKVKAREIADKIIAGLGELN